MRAVLVFVLATAVACGTQPPPAAVAPQAVTAPAPAASGELGAPRKRRRP